jgi:hypothetical protein
MPMSLHIVIAQTMINTVATCKSKLHVATARNDQMHRNPPGRRESVLYLPFSEGLTDPPILATKAQLSPSGAYNSPSNGA